MREDTAQVLRRQGLLGVRRRFRAALENGRIRRAGMRVEMRVVHRAAFGSESGLEHGGRASRLHCFRASGGSLPAHAPSHRPSDRDRLLMQWLTCTRDTHAYVRWSLDHRGYFIVLVCD